MAFKYTEEQLNKLDKELLIQLFLGMQDQLEELTKQTQSLNDKMQLMMEQIVLSNKNRFGRSSEKMTAPGQIRFMEVDGKIVLTKRKRSVICLHLNRKTWNSGYQKRKSRQARKRPICQVFPYSVSIIT